MNFHDFEMQLRAEFPKHHLEINTYPTGGSITAWSCEECGSDSYATAMWRYADGQTIDSAVTELKDRL